MDHLVQYFIRVCFLAIAAMLSNGAFAPYKLYAQTLPVSPSDTIWQADTVQPLPFPLNPAPLIPGTLHIRRTAIDFQDPPFFTTDVEFDPLRREYILRRQIGGIDIGTQRTMTFEEFQDYHLENSLRNYWKDQARQRGGDRQEGIIPQIHIGGEVFDRIFGASTIDIRPQGSAELIFGVMSNRRDDPAIDVRRQRTANFDFQQRIQMNVLAKIGDKIQFNANHNTEATFDFENRLKLKYEGKEDEIIKLIEAGDVTLPLNSSLITGSQSLFGLKTQLQFGRTTVTSVFSQQKSETRNITVQGGAQKNNFSLKALDYEENRHFFISHYFRNQYEEALSRLPIVTSNINITKIEVWVTTRGAAVTENRNIVAFMDLGEHQPFNNQLYHSAPFIVPDNSTNNLFILLNDTVRLRDINRVNDYLATHPLQLVSGRDFEKVENARKLNQTEFTFNSKLGFISLNFPLSPDQVLAVAYQYTIVGQDDRVFQVGEFSDQGINTPQALMVKLLKSTAVDTRIPMWDLMMKNVYNLNAFRINSDDFTLNILYAGGVNSVPTGFLLEGPPGVKGVPLIRVMNFDNLNPQLNSPPDGVFDFIDGAATGGGTIQSSNGRIFFTVLEPFGEFLRRKLVDPELGDKYAFDSLYTLTKSGALQFPDRNRFIIEGYYKSAGGSEISLNAINVPRGSVRVTAGGAPLTENVHFTVDYTLGRVRIIDEGILNSGTPVNISLESQNMLGLMNRRMVGTRVEHRFNDDFHLGGTLMNLHESPLTQKVSFGNEPISNTIWGLDLGYQTESMWITRMLDRLPFYSTKTPSRIIFNSEFAHFIPGHSRAVGKTGTTYIDDFEGSKSTISLKTLGHWHMASVPQHQARHGMFPEAAPGTGLMSGFNRALLAWYIIDPLFYEPTSAIRPPNIDRNELSRHSVRPVKETEVFPNADPPAGLPMNLPVLNLAFYPSLRGPYNFDTEPTSFSRGVNSDGSLQDPNTRWGGIMRALDNTDFEATNIEYIEFWLMDPFAEDTLNPGGYLFLNLGDISEDVLRDGRRSFENGLPTTADLVNVDSTIWGRVPTVQALVNAFDSEIDSRPYQDLGYDGLSTEEEQMFHSDYLTILAQMFGEQSQAYQSALEDPSSDDYQYFRGGNLDEDERFSSVSMRYRRFNHVEGNSPTAEQSPEIYPTLATNFPNTEDINRDNTLNDSERYFQYVVELHPDKMRVGQNYITDIYTARNIPLPNNTRGEVTWYQFKVPLRNPDQVIGNIQDFRSIRFMRMFMKGWQQEVILRFATLELVRNEWRRYYSELHEPGDWIPAQDDTRFEISALNFEENGFREPVPYVLPPGIEREINLGTIHMQQKNEQSMSLRVRGLADGDARATYKTTDFDFRQFKRLQMYVHAEKVYANEELNAGDMTAFIRFGSDFTEDYYEYEVPLEFTPWGTSASDAEAIWPVNNRFDIELQKLVEAKRQRNEEIKNENTAVTVAIPFYVADGNSRITVVGNPSLSTIKALMIGIRNPKQRTPADTDDGLPKSAEIWVNELRLTDFNDQSGWAATARMNATLSDLGSLMVSGIHSSPGFGSIEERVTERAMEAYSQFDIATSLELGKLLPEELGLRVPMHFDYSVTLLTPQYNPLDPDVLYRDEIRDLSKHQRDSLRLVTRDITQRRNINFMNVRKVQTDASETIRFWDIENFDFSYSYSEINHSNIDIEFDRQRIFRGGIGYTFSHNPRPIKPFENFTNIRLINDFNFHYLPRTVSFRTDMFREYNERLLRNKSTARILIDTNFIKRWEWSRMYDIKYDLTQNLKLEFNAAANAFIDEPPGSVDRDRPDFRMMRDSIMQEIYDLGTLTNYVQNMNVSYVLPINKISMFDWINVNARYTSMFRWQASPRSIQSILGNTIENDNSIQINSTLRFTTLYNKFDFLKNLNRPTPGPGRPAPGRPSAQNIRGEEERGEGEGEEEREREREQGDETEPVPFGEEEERQPLDLNRYFKLFGNTLLRVLTGIKDVSISYTENNGTLLPGFMPEPTMLGNRMSDMAPGLGFVFGDQRDIRQTAVQNNWLSTDTLLNAAYLVRHSNNLVLRANLEPLPALRIDITADRSEAFTHQEYFRMGPDGDFSTFAAQQSGNFSMSFITWQTAFARDRKDHTSEVFESLKRNRYDVARRLAEQNPFSHGTNPDGFPDGYGGSSQDVLIPAFIAAYTGRDPNDVSLNPFPVIPLPNWRITYNGLTRMEFFRRHFRTFTLSHAYRSSYNIGAFLTNLAYRPDMGMRDASGNFIAERRIDVISINEQFSPLINIDITWHNSLLTRFEIRHSRSLAFSFVNNQLTEVTSREYIIGAGYRIKDVRFVVASVGPGRSRQRISSDLNLKLDLSLRDNKTVLRRIDEPLDQVSAGQRMIAINFSADYVINQNLSARAFFERTSNIPYLTFLNAHTFAGISLRFTLAR